MNSLLKGNNLRKFEKKNQKYNNKCGNYTKMSIVRGFVVGVEIPVL